MIEQIKQDLANNYPEELVDILMDSYVELKQNFILLRHEPAELNGGKFVEACYRILQYVSKNSYTPPGKPIPDLIGKLRAIEQLPASTCNESCRIHIPRTLASIYNIRNKRGVSHIGGDVNPNLADSTIIAAVADWVLAELYRINYRCTLDEAQKVVDGLVQLKIPLIYEVDDKIRVLKHDLSFPQKTLLILAHLYPTKVMEKDLIDWVEHHNPSVFRNSVLKRLHATKQIEYKNKEWCLILPPGLLEAEKIYREHGE